MVECLHSKPEALRTILSTSKKGEKKKAEVAPNKTVCLGGLEGKPQ